MTGFLSPAESLDSYFDELLSEACVLTAPPLDPVAAADLPAVAAPQSLPLANATESESQAAWAEGTSALEDSDRVKLERLLRAAQSQILPKVDAPSIQAPQLLVAPTLEVQTAEVAVTASLVADAIMPDLPSPAYVTGEVAQCETSEDIAQWNANGRPEWAQSQFDVLLFDVAGLQLAVPLVALGQIQPLTDELTPLFGQAAWFMGLQPTPQGQIRTVNTALFVMPERYNASFLTSAKYVVSIDGVPWGLAVDQVKQPITLQPEDVRWRGDRSKRAWLAGTVKDHMCVLLDVVRMGQILQGEDKNFRAPAIN